MKKHTVEIWVGIFVILGAVCVTYLSVRVGKMELFGDKYYTLYAKFTSVSGLKEGASVEMAGVRVGKVSGITLDAENMLATLELQVEKHIQLTDDSTAAIKTSGLIGDKFVDVQTGGSDEILKSGSEIENTQDPLDLEGILGKYAHGNVE